LFWIFSPKTSKAFLFTWSKQLPQRPSHNFPHPSLNHTLAHLAKTREPLPLFSQPPFGQTKRPSFLMAIYLFSALFLFSSSIKGLKIKQHKPFIYVFLFQD